MHNLCMPHHQSGKGSGWGPHLSTFCLLVATLASSNFFLAIVQKYLFERSISSCTCTTPPPHNARYNASYFVRCVVLSHLFCLCGWWDL
jgi:hypothetical protein